MKVGEIWIMKKDVLKDYNTAYAEDEDEDTHQEDTKVEILNLKDDYVYFIYLFGGTTEKLTRNEFLTDYEKIYD